VYLWTFGSTLGFKPICFGVLNQ